MCGIFAVLRRPSTREAPEAAEVTELAAAAQSALADSRTAKDFSASARALNELDALLRGAPGAEAMLADDSLIATVTAATTAVEAHVRAAEEALDAGQVEGGGSLEEMNEALVGLRDVLWFITKDRLRTARAVKAMVASAPLSPSLVECYTSIQMALSSIDRLEVRGRDSAGISVLVHDHGLSAGEVAAKAAARSDSLFLNNAVEVSGATMVFVYKAAAEIGALGDNVRHLRAAIERDELLREMLARPGTQATVVSHTRWASVGTVSEANTHPIDSQEAGSAPGPYVVASLNGDVDNYLALRAEDRLEIAPEITTDAKVIPAGVSRRLAEGNAPLEAFRKTVDKFEGSVAIASAIADVPASLFLAVYGSGQGCYIGFTEDAFLVASEPYGLVEECDTYVRLDGETASAASGKKGQVVELSRQFAGTLEGIERLSYGGEALPLSQDDVTTPEITTRDVDRGDAPHFLLKEISESPDSVRRTIRGKITGSQGRLRVSLDDTMFPAEIREALKSREINQVIVIGQGTASIAGQTVVSMLEYLAPYEIAVTAKKATELSGFGMRDDMSDTLIVAVSQSGTTTDTNRTVDLVRARGAKVIAIVNRRESDLTQKADGVLYTSDGRDVEMSVASTKAFYAQVVASTLLAIAITDQLGAGDAVETQAVLSALRKLPEAMTQVLGKRRELAGAAKEFAPSRRSWAMTGSGPNHIAAQELRIKLSELCYKSIACDFTEDKKHIDLSAEPMIVVCAAGLTGSNASDIAKEVAIYKAHKALPIVFASEGSNFDAPAVIEVPALHPAIDFVLSTMAGHLFGYEAALAIDAQGKAMRAARAVLDDVLSAEHGDEEQKFAALRTAMVQPAAEILALMRSRQLDGHLQPSTAVRLSALLRAATGAIILDAVDAEVGTHVTPLSMMGALMETLSQAVDELSRPIDAVKHQAKTVTVGISRAEESFAENPLVIAAIESGVPRERLTYRSMRLLSALQPAVEEVLGYTRYEVAGDVGAGTATLRVLDKGGVAKSLVSRSETDPRLTGTKHRAAYERMVTVARGGRDQRSVVLVPEIVQQRVVGMMLLHVRFAELLDADTAVQVMKGYRNRYAALVDAVTETEPDFDDSQLGRVAVLNLLVDPVRILAQHWRNSSDS